MPIIGGLKEKSLHAALKARYAQPGDHIEHPIDGYVIDLVHGDLLIEIQTGNFGSMKQKLTRLLPAHPILLVHPIAAEKWLIKVDASGEVLQRRRSPKRGNWYTVFKELTGIATLAAHPNLSLEIILTREEELWINDGAGSWRRKRWSIHDRRLLEVLDTRRFESPQDYLNLLPDGLAEPFTSLDAAAGLVQPRWLIGKMLYCLRQMGLIQPVGKRGNAILYERCI